MPLPRIYQPQTLKPASHFKLDSKSSHHIAHVLRSNTGDRLTIFNGEGGEYTAVIKAIHKKTVEVEVLTFIPCETESDLTICLAQGIARGEKMDFIIQKAVELGVKKIIPLITERCNVKLAKEREGKRLEHWRSVVISACEQSGRNRLPEMGAPLTFTNWLPTVKADMSIVLTPHSTNKLTSKKLPVPATLVLLIGPEGGLSEAEVRAAEQSGFIVSGLGPRILRTETAGMAAISVLQYQYGDFG